MPVIACSSPIYGEVYCYYQQETFLFFGPLGSGVDLTPIHIINKDLIFFINKISYNIEYGVVFRHTIHNVKRSTLTLDSLYLLYGKKCEAIIHIHICKVKVWLKFLNNSLWALRWEMAKFSVKLWIWFCGRWRNSGWGGARTELDAGTGRAWLASPYVLEITDKIYMLFPLFLKEIKNVLKLLFFITLTFFSTLTNCLVKQIFSFPGQSYPGFNIFTFNLRF